MLKPFFTKVSVLFMFALLPCALLANTEIIDKNVVHEVGNSVIKNFKKKGVKGFTVPKVKLRSFVLPIEPNRKKNIEIVPLKLVIDDVIVFRTETSSATELMAYNDTVASSSTNRTPRPFMPG